LGDALGLKAGVGIPVNTANGQTTAYATRLPELRLGELVFRDVRGGLTRGMEGDQILLGMSVLKNVSLLQEGNQLVIRQAR
jgi:aspartyl protease family protein